MDTMMPFPRLSTTIAAIRNYLVSLNQKSQRTYQIASRIVKTLNLN